MKALLSNAIGGPETLIIGDIAEPVPGKGQLLLKVVACAINFPDALMIEDKYQMKAERPFAPGSEVSGIVEAVGEGVDGFAIGDKVIALVFPGGLAEKVLAKVDRVFKVPDGIDMIAASGLIFTYGTTIHGLLDRGGLKAGETLLVLGAAGGIGISGIEIGKAYGARVIAAVSSEEKAAAAREAGADDVVIYPRGPLDRDQSKALAEAFKAACGKDGAQVIYDPVGGDYAEPALRSIGWEGRYLVVGFPAGIPKLALNLTLLKACDVRGVFWGAWLARNPEANRAHVETLFRLWGEGKIRPRVTETFPLEKGGEAIARLATRGAIGKLVVTIG